MGGSPSDSDVEKNKEIYAEGNDDGLHPEKTHIPALEDGTQESEGFTSVPWTFTRVIAIASLCLVYVGAQAVLYMTGGSLSYIAVDINTTFQNWLLTANTLAVTAVVPFVGYITDLLGRRYVAIFGSLCLIVGSVVQTTSHSLLSSIWAMTIAGVGAGICELVALAGVAEITPVKWRGVTLSIVTFSILPFIPYILYIEELHVHSTWRWGMGIVCIWNGIGTIGLILCYHPPPRGNTAGMTKMEIVKRIDYGGAFLSIAGVTLFLVGLQYGGYQVPWTNAKAVAPLTIGIILIIAFPLYEYFLAPYPMVPSAIFKGQNVVTIAYIVVFIAGMLFYSVLGFFPLMLQALYTAGPVTTGLRGLGYPLAILGGACIINALLSYTRGHVREMFVLMSVLMTAFVGALASSTPFTPDQATAFATIGSFGLGGIIVPALTVALYACPDKYIGTTAALSLAVRFLGGSIGTAIYYNIFNNKFSKLLPEYAAQPVLAAGLPAESLPQFLMAIAIDSSGKKALAVPGATVEALMAAALPAKTALADSLQYVWYSTIAFGCVSIISCCFLPNIRKYMTNRVAVDIH